MKRKLEDAAFILATVGMIFACAAIPAIVGCSLIENAAGQQLEDIDGWDLSACIESGCGRSTCLKLFLDNDEKILGGRTAVEALFDALPLGANDNVDGVCITSNGVE